MKTFYVVNPVSRAGRTRKVWSESLKLVEKMTPEFDWKFTDGPMHAQELAREACKRGFERVVSVGGDGTLNEVINGVLRSGRAGKIYVGLLSLGTGSDFRKTLGIPSDFEKMLKVIAECRVKTIDAGHIKFTLHDGRTADRYFVNIADAGIGGETVARVNATTKIFGGFISFLWGTLVTLLKFRPRLVRYSIDGKREREESITMIVVANGQFFGGGMHIAPDAAVDDGLFDVVIVKDAGLADFLRYSSMIYRGRKVEGDPRVEYLRAKKVRCTSDDVVLLDVDGEQPGMLPAEFTVLPGALNFIVP